MSGSDVKAVLALVGLALIVTGAFWLSAHNYRECRAHGFSMIYCVTEGNK
jgi:hypothetical protein